MIRFLKNIGRYSLICPVIFLSKEARSNGIQLLKSGAEFLIRDEKVLLALGICFSLWLIYHRSMKVYTYSMDEELEYLGRLPVVWEREKKLYFPKWYEKKSSTGRFVLKTGMREKQRNKRKTKLLVITKENRTSLTWNQLMEFQLFKGERRSAY